MDKLEKAKKERTKVAIQSQGLRCRDFVCFPAEFHFVPLLFFFVNYTPCFILPGSVSSCTTFFQAVQMKLFALPYRSVSLGCLFHWPFSCFVSIFKPELITWYTISQLQTRCPVKNSLFLNL